MRADAATRSVVDTAQGVLMERLGCTAAEAGTQLARLAHESATPLAELAAEITAQHLAAEYGQPAEDGKSAGNREPAGATQSAGGGEPGGNGEQARGRQRAAGGEPAGTREPAAGGEPAGTREPAAGGEPAGTGEPTRTREPAGTGEPAGTREQAGGDSGWRGLALAGAELDLAPDGDRIAEAALAQVLGPLGGSAVALWLIAPDGSLELAGQAGLGMREAGRWRHIPPVMDCPAQRVAQGGTEVFWPAGAPTRPGAGARLVAWGGPGGSADGRPVGRRRCAGGLLARCAPGLRGSCAPPAGGARRPVRAGTRHGGHGVRSRGTGCARRGSLPWPRRHARCRSRRRCLRPSGLRPRGN